METNTMSIESLRRVTMRIEGQTTIKQKDLRKAIMKEIGTDERTIERTIKKLQELDFIKRLSRWTWRINQDEIYN